MKKLLSFVMVMAVALNVTISMQAKINWKDPKVIAALAAAGVGVVGATGLVVADQIKQHNKLKVVSELPSSMGQSDVPGVPVESVSVERSEEGVEPPLSALPELVRTGKISHKYAQNRIKAARDKINLKALQEINQDLEELQSEEKEPSLTISDLAARSTPNPRSSTGQGVVPSRTSTQSVRGEHRGNLSKYMSE